MDCKFSVDNALLNDFFSFGSSLGRHFILCSDENFKKEFFNSHNVQTDTHMTSLSRANSIQLGLTAGKPLNPKQAVRITDKAPSIWEVFVFGSIH